MLGIGDWVVKMIASRLRGLGVDELKDLIHYSDEKETLNILKGHLLSGNFKWPNVGFQKDKLLQMIDAKLNDIDWSEIEKLIEIVE